MGEARLHGGSGGGELDDRSSARVGGELAAGVGERTIRE